MARTNCSACTQNSLVRSTHLPTAKAIAIRGSGGSGLRPLSRLEAVAVEPPKAHHDLADWFSHAVASRMRTVGLECLGDLAATISTAGYRWWETVPRIGEKSASRIVQWLKENESSIGRRLSARCEVPLRSLDRQELEAIEGGGTAVLPLERFVLPAALDGSGAKNRAPAHMNQSGASNDLEAVRIWLGRTAGRTFRSDRPI